MATVFQSIHSHRELLHPEKNGCELNKIVKIVPITTRKKKKNASYFQVQIIIVQ